jgi:asparagine synthase (glutamine-hydrolysing)
MNSFFASYSFIDESILFFDENEISIGYNKFNNSQTAIIGDINLDNKEALLENFPDLKNSSNNLINDTSIVLACYKKWGTKCTEKLLGNFAFLIWDNENKILLCGRDHLGLKPLFYYQTSKVILISNDLNLLVSKKENATINANKIAAMVFPNTLHFFRDQTWFEDVFLFPAGSNFIINQKEVRKVKYWSPTIGKELTFKNDSDFVEAFQEKIFNAVNNRLKSNSPVSALLSGGLDSSAIVSVAAKILEKQNKELQTFSVVLPDDNDPVLKDERYYIDQFKGFQNVKINYITAPEKGFFSTLQVDSSMVLGPNITSRHYLYEAFTKKASELGSNIILDGVWGELGPTWHGYGCYAEMFVSGNWIQLGKELVARNTLTGEPILYNIAKNILKPILNQYFQNDNIDLHQISSDHCLQKDYVDFLKSHIGSKINNNSISIPNTIPNQRQNHVNLIHLIQRKASYELIIAEVEYLYPFKDKNLIEFCLNLPLEYKIRDGYKRYTIRKGLENILPPKIQWRNTKTPFSPDYMRRYKKQLPFVLAFLEDIQSNDPIRTIIDIAKLKQWLKIPVRDDERGTFAEKVALHLVPQTIYLIHFLRRFDNFKIK